MKDFNYYHIISIDGNEFDFHCDSLSISHSGNIELVQIWNDVTVYINIKDIFIISQIHPMDAGMKFICYNDLVRAFTENNIGFEVV